MENNLEQLKQALRKAGNDAIHSDRPKKIKNTSREPTGFNKKYDVDDKLKTILSNDSFNGGNITDTITPTQLSTICQKFFKDKYNQNTYVSLTDTETPVYEIFSEYLIELNGGKLSVEYKPSPKCFKANRDNLNPNQIISYCCGFLKWYNR